MLPAPTTDAVSPIVVFEDPHVAVEIHRQPDSKQKLRFRYKAGDNAKGEDEPNTDMPLTYFDRGNLAIALEQIGDQSASGDLPQVTKLCLSNQRSFVKSYPMGHLGPTDWLYALHVPSLLAAPIILTDQQRTRAVALLRSYL